MTDNQFPSTHIPLGWESQIPMVDLAKRDGENITTPEWMIGIDGILHSSIKGYEDYAELFGWFAEQSRVTKGGASGQLFSSSNVQHSNVIIIIPNGVYIPILDEKMTSGKNLDLVTIVRLANITTVKVPIQKIEYVDCQVNSIQQKLDQVIISIRPTIRRNIVIQYAQNGDKLGQTVSEFNYTTGE